VKHLLAETVEMDKQRLGNNATMEMIFLLTDAKTIVRLLLSIDGEKGVIKTG
jgi:hypothetical protein